MTIAPGTKLGPYEILSPIGAGGMGEVYRARDTRLDRLVAVKVISGKLSGDSLVLARFEREAKAVAALSHPNVLSIFDYGQEGDVTYAVMELQEGETLREAVGAGPMPVSKSVGFAIQIARGLAAAHEKGIVHRDLKPGNVFLTRNGHVKILDFGLAKLERPIASWEVAAAETTATAHTTAGAIMGTIAYMSPEQARGLPTDARSDIFSFGAALYEMLSGRRPFRGETPADILAALIKDDPPPLPASVPPPVDRVVRRCLEKRPEDRFTSALDLTFALEALSAGSGTLDAAAAQPGGRSGARRWWLGASVVGSALLLALAFALDAGGARTWLFEGRAVAPIRSIAVLPLENLSGDPGQDFFADGMTEALITQLAKISGFEKVISRTSVMRYKGARKPVPQVGRELGVGAIIEGTVQRAGDRVRITVQLVDARADRNLWAESYDRDARDVLTLQGEIAAAVSRQVQVALTPSEIARVGKKRMVDPEVYDSYLRAATLLAQRGEAPVREAIAGFERVIGRDPAFAPAYSDMGTAYMFLVDRSFERPAEGFPKAKAALEKALGLDPDLALAHAQMGYYKFEAEWDWEGAGYEYRKALELDPNNVRAIRMCAYYSSMMRRFDEGISLCRRAIELEPTESRSRIALAGAFLGAGRYEEGAAQARTALSSNPGDVVSNICLAQCLTKLGRREEALACVAVVEAAQASWEQPEFLGGLGWVYGMAGQRQKASAVLARLEAIDRERFADAFYVSQVCASLGDDDGAMRWLEKGYERHDGGMTMINAGLFTDGLRADPRFKALLCRMKFPGACQRATTKSAERRTAS